MKKLFPQALVAALALVTSIALAQDTEQADEDITRLLKMRLGTDEVAPAVETGVEGVYQTRFGNKFAYLIEGGRYVFIGDLVDLKMARNITEASRREMVVEELAGFGENKRIVFPASKQELAVLSVFTDTSCGYCQQLHKEVSHLQEAGISVHYYPFPRGGNRGPGYSDLRKVWCADDRLSAMSIAKGAVAGNLDSSDSCESAQIVDDGYQLGNRLGISGTPALFADNGVHFNGYVPYQQLIPQLIKQ
jgi:thiol:disulfide interchange protein DsbC